MGTKNNPSIYDCYSKAKSDEPMFVLLARDPLAPSLVRLWADLAKDRSSNGPQKSQEALACAREMQAWYDTNKK